MPITHTIVSLNLPSSGYPQRLVGLQRVANRAQTWPHSSYLYLPTKNGLSIYSSNTVIRTTASPLFCTSIVHAIKAYYNMYLPPCLAINMLVRLATYLQATTSLYGFQVRHPLWGSCCIRPYPGGASGASNTKFVGNGSKPPCSLYTKITKG